MAYDTWNSKVYSDMLYPLAQEQGKLAGTVTTSYGFDNGEFKFVDQIGAVDFESITDRLGNTNWTEIDKYRRRISKDKSGVAKIFDSFEKLDMMVDPTSKLSMQILAGVGRKKDATIIAAATATAYSGKDGTSTTTLASWQSSRQLITESGTAGLTIDKLRKADKIFGLNNVSGEKRYLVASPAQKEDLLKATEVSSSDYNTVRALVNGEINSFCGFEFIWSNQLSIATSKRLCIAYVPSGIELAIAKEFDITADRLVERRNAIGFQSYLYMGASRLEESKVVSIECYEA